MQSYGGLPALLFLSLIKTDAMIGRKLSQSIIFNRSRQSPSLLNFCNLFSSAKKRILFHFQLSFPCFTSIISYFTVYCNSLRIFRGSLILYTKIWLFSIVKSSILPFSHLILLLLSPSSLSSPTSFSKRNPSERSRTLLFFFIFFFFLLIRKRGTKK